MSTLFDHNLAITNFAGDFSRGKYGQLLAHRQAAIKLAVNFGDINLRRPFESAALRDLNHSRIHGRLNQSLHHQCVAIGDLNAFEFDIGPHGQLAAAFLGRLGGLGRVRGISGTGRVGRVLRRSLLSGN